MELVIIIIAIIAIVIIYFFMGMNVKELNKVANNSKLNKIADKYPENKEICKSILKMLGNDTTKIEENVESDTTLYIAIQDKILVGNTHGSFTRIQTIAHECLHSIQDRKILIFNFIYSNIYFLYWIIICGLVIFKKLSNEMIYANILLILSFIYYAVRVFLENDAMIKAEFIAKEYMEKQPKAIEQEINEVVNGFKQLNRGCIKGTNCSLFINIMIKFVIFSVLALIF